MEDGHCKTVDEVLNYFNVDPDKGLSLDQVKRNQEKYGLNEALLTGTLIEQTRLHTVTLLAQRSFIVEKNIVRLGTADHLKT
ncbi:Calcium-transporting ATPase sarcoplasmic/endoplasmic reticulum type [Melipona quadrifasciata]|uniref:Calcium-transporting ATPase sarcoplasmic/endoplasmic reticulum type n=1 Tax=Melipona quadrifasciata TaxID=166423 RepID=A0A0M9A2S4_9HYME|nr:Calcium-transporting ATPase sarcoplasmic/endoplasmic reticulum type [Melipona quadrifasciata]